MALWRPYFCKPCVTIFTFHLVNLSTLIWSHEVVRWLMNVFSHNFWNSPWNFVPWSMTTLTRAPNLQNTMSKNPYVVISLLQSGNATNSNHLEKCSIITKTYRLCQDVKFNGPRKSKLHRYPSLIIGKGCRWSVGALKDVQTWSHTIHVETNWRNCNYILHHQYYVWNKLYFHWTPKWPNFSWPCLTRLSCCFRRSTTFTCPFAHICRNELPSLLNYLALCTTWSFSLGVNPIGTSFAYKYAMTHASS